MPMHAWVVVAPSTAYAKHVATKLRTFPERRRSILRNVQTFSEAHFPAPAALAEIRWPHRDGTHAQALLRLTHLSGHGEGWFSFVG